MNQEVITFGCRLNAYESEVIRHALTASGEENIAVFNTCAVTKEAERQARQAIRKYRREHPGARIVVTGCSAQLHPGQYGAMPEVDLVLGNEEKLNKKNYAPRAADHEPRLLVNDIMSVRETAGHMVASFENKARAFIQVQNGCNHRCTFCIIPYARGNSRSVPVGEIVTQVRRLVEQGFNELVLTGVDITDYGLDLPGKPTLGQMIRRLLHLVPELPRLRLSSIDVAEVDGELMQLIAHEPRLMPHFHLSLQSGDDMILKRMKRRHLRSQVLAFCEQVRRARSDIAFGADVIAGFPTESDAMFNNTLRLVEEAGLSFLHVFPYSEREGTPAANIPAYKQVPKIVRRERARLLREAGEKQRRKFFESLVGKTVQAVVEKERFGRTEHFAGVEFDRSVVSGSLISVHVTGVSDAALVGKV